jgi:hypothetical protein
LPVLVKDKDREGPVQLSVPMRLKLSRGSDLVVQCINQDYTFHTASLPSVWVIHQPDLSRDFLKNAKPADCLRRPIQLWLPLVHLWIQAVMLLWQ